MSSSISSSTSLPLKVAVCPYCERDGLRTFRDTEVMAFYDRMAMDGTVNIIFHAGDIRSSKDFLKRMKNPGAALYVVFYGEDIVGLIWLTHFEGKSCRVHFTSFSEVWNEDTVSIGKAAIRQILYMYDDNNDYVFDVLLGLIPSRNMRAVKWLKKMGLKEVGEIPNALWDAEEGESIPGTLLHLTR